MTAPEVSDVASMSFMMTAGTTRGKNPNPLYSRVRIDLLPQREIAVIRFSGYAAQEDVNATTLRLQDGLKTEGSVTVAQTFLMRYDSPWIPGFLRRNEVAIEIKW